MTRGPRPITEHYHPDMWTRGEQHRHEDFTNAEIDAIQKELRALGNRITMMVGAIGLLVFLLTFFAPFIRAFIGLDVSQ